MTWHRRKCGSVLIGMTVPDHRWICPMIGDRLGPQWQRPTADNFSRNDQAPAIRFSRRLATLGCNILAEPPWQSRNLRTSLGAGTLQC